ncbi:UNVERIFIED_CONTAM: hypothetical protein Sradi_3173500 [Sesamum radiatum]|uniref:Uncharacterized protein n=1 Tax=Sesamum radiatum TaxID=300843 RepID=A0AAW2RES3_SESRA
MEGLKGNSQRNYQEYCGHIAPPPEMGETHFCFVYGSEVVTPIEIGIEPARVQMYDQAKNIKQRETDLMFLPERRELSYVKILKYKKQTGKIYNEEVKSRVFQFGDLVL